MTDVRTRRSPARLLPALACAVLTLGSCGGSSSTPPGTLVVTLSGNGGDFVFYGVTISSIALTNTNGTGLTLPPFLYGVAEIADLAALTDRGELFGAPAVPSGTYKSATVGINFAGASVWVNGQTVAASVVDAKGNPLGLVPVNLTFDPANPLTITAGKSTRLAIDIDLAASNSVDTSGSTPKVQVRPYAVMRPAAADTTPLRVRGSLVTVESASSDYIINARPLTDPSISPTSALGAVTVATDTSTYFNVNGVPYTGAAGLAAMTSLSQSTPVAAYGTLADLSGITPRFHATAVYAGTSLEGLSDHVTGIVSARSGNVLTVHGAHVFNRLTTCGTTASNFYSNNVTVTIGSQTTVTQDGVIATGLGLNLPSVGQEINVSGQCSVDSSGNLTGLDAATCTDSSGNKTPCQVRLAPTRLWGTLSSATTGSAVLDVLTFGNFAPAGFSFAGTGTPAANPAAYAVNTGTLDESGVAAGTMLRVDGLVTPFGGAPPDFDATAIALGRATEQRLVVEWVNGGATAPFSSASSTGLVVDLSNANLGAVHYIYTGPAALDIKSLPSSPTITTTGANQSDLELSVGNATPSATSVGVSEFASASAFASALSTTFSGTNKIYRLVAVGQFNSAANTFVASRISAALNE